MLHEITTPPDGAIPLAAFPELDKGFHQLPVGAADAHLTRCLLKLQQLPVDEASPTWAARLGQSVVPLLLAASGHSLEVLDSLIGRLAHWTMDRFAQSDAIAAELLVALAQHSPRSLAVAGRTLVNRLVASPSQPPMLPAWTATLIGLLRQAATEPDAAAVANAALACLPDWRTALAPQAFEQVLASDEREALLRLVGHVSLLSLIDVSQQPSRPLSEALLADEPGPAIAPDMQAYVHGQLSGETVRVHWLLTPRGHRRIEALMQKATTLLPPPACQQLRQEIVLSLTRSAAIEHGKLSGTEAALVLSQLLRWVPDTPAAWALVWNAVRQLSSMAKAHPSRAAPDNDRSRTANTLLCPRGLDGRVEQVGWRLALLKQSGLPLSDCLAQLVQQVPCSPNGQPLLARVLQTALATSQEHEQALAELCCVHELPLHIGAETYTRNLLLRARMLALNATPQSGTTQEALVLQVAAQFGPGVLMLGLFSHLQVELRFPSWSVDKAQWLAAQLQASVAALPTGLPADWAPKICSHFNDDLEQVLPPAQFQAWSTWLRTL